ncbi:hypothetical protein [Pseudobacter ginsenosidimutans]|uniref:Uncharacterized protein n=1 Tax=Pseudobacter ginsenosidimutans TaxID=661488 RepID=A0A4V2F1W4_9BACT|nr:hypothetical protein [Pseudobacter ginsenosidimutans]QEC43770.1 hypothetical protein FSB84_19565 [Pseudobacter ginsenosidimutans]RZS75186.1 hypothetical protein EV199_1048 [Pseudobacter ginsenosidimutans]
MPIQRSTLSAEDIKAMQQWVWKYRTAAWFWGIFIFPLLGFSDWLVQVFIEEAMSIIPLLVFFGLMDILAIWLFVKCTRKVRFVQKSIDRNEKTITHGNLQALQTKLNGRFIYTINNHPLAVISATQPLALVGANILREAQVRLHSVAVSPKQQLLLAVVYEQIPPPQKQILTITPEEKAASNNKKDSLEALKITGIILGVICAVSGIFFTGGGLIMIFGVYLFCFLLIAAVIYFTYRSVEAYTEKLVITGIVTEQLRVQYRIGRHGSYKQMNWYRIGNELVPGTIRDQDGLQAGDTARFEFYAGKNGKRHGLIRVSKI